MCITKRSPHLYGLPWTSIFTESQHTVLLPLMTVSYTSLRRHTGWTQRPSNVAEEFLEMQRTNAKLTLEISTGNYPRSDSTSTMVWSTSVHWLRVARMRSMTERCNSCGISRYGHPLVLRGGFRPSTKSVGKLFLQLAWYLLANTTCSSVNYIYCQVYRVFASLLNGMQIFSEASTKLLKSRLLVSVLAKKKYFG